MVHFIKKQGPPPWGRKIAGWRTGRSILQLFHNPNSRANCATQLNTTPTSFTSVHVDSPAFICTKFLIISAVSVT